MSGSPFAAGSAPTHVTVDPSGRFVYTANAGDGTVSAYTINASSGALTPVYGSPFASGNQAIWVAVDPSAQFAYVTCNCGNVWAYSINSSTGALTQISGSPFAAGAEPAGIAICAVVAGTCTGGLTGAVRHFGKPARANPRAKPH